MSQWTFIRNVLWKTLLLFALVNFGFIGCDLSHLGRISVYNRLAPGRERFPFGENQRKAYNLSTSNLEMMFASHLISGTEKQADELRVLVLGDSSVWGSLLRPEETLAGQLNRLEVTTCQNKTARFYNLGYPTLSLTKDVMILDYAMRYQPDLILWPVTLEAFPLSRQTESPLVADNPDQVRVLVRRYQLPLQVDPPVWTAKSAWDKTLIARRRELADWLRLQLYAGMWAATGIDQDYPGAYTPAQRDFKAGDDAFHQFKPPVLPEEALGPGLLDAGFAAADGVPVILVNEPVLISTGVNSQVRYNFYYPRWAYDQYRAALADKASQMDWVYVDMWDLIPNQEFTNSAIHLSADGMAMLAKSIKKTIEGFLCK